MSTVKISQLTAVSTLLPTALIEIETAAGNSRKATIQEVFDILPLDNTKIFVGNSSNVAAGVAMSGDATITNTGVLAIANGAITNAKVSASAAIAYSKLNLTGTIVDGDLAGGSYGSITALGTLTSLTVNGPATFQQSADFDSFMNILEIAEPASPTANTLRVFAVDVNAKSILQTKDSGGFVTNIASDSLIIVRNTAGVTVNAGEAVYITGSTGGIPDVSKAQADSSATTPALGLLAESLANNASGYAMIKGTVKAIDTSAFTEGQEVFLSATTAGAITTTPPSHPNLIQRIGVVTKSNASTGTILVNPASMSGDDSGTILNNFKIGDGAAGAKTIDFVADFIGTLSMTPTAARTVTIPDATTTLVGTGIANSYGDFLQTFKDDKLKINSPDDADGVTFVNSNQTAERNLTIPVLTANDTIATLGLANTFTQNQNIVKASPRLQLIGDGTDSSARLTFNSDRTTPANDKLIGEVLAQENDSIGTGTIFGQFQFYSEVVADGSEAGRFNLLLASGGSVTPFLTVNLDDNQQFQVRNSDLQINATRKLFLDGGGDSYITESASNQVKVFAGGVEGVNFSQLGGVGTAVFSAPDAVLTDGYFKSNSVGFSLDEAGNNLRIKVLYADGTTFKTATIALT